jgi:hypothetical protein
MFKSIDTYVDLITMVSPFVAYMIKKDDTSSIDQNFSNRITSVLRLLKVFRILRLRKIVRKYIVNNK